MHGEKNSGGNFLFAGESDALYNYRECETASPTEAPSALAGPSLTISLSSIPSVGPTTVSEPSALSVPAVNSIAVGAPENPAEVLPVGGCIAPSTVTRMSFFDSEVIDNSLHLPGGQLRFRGT